MSEHQVSCEEFGLDYRSGKKEEFLRKVSLGETLWRTDPSLSVLTLKTLHHFSGFFLGGFLHNLFRNFFPGEVNFCLRSS
jgi:hypothetical protein